MFFADRSGTIWRASSPIAAHVLALRQHMAPLRALHVLLRCPGFEVQLCIERIQLEKIPVRRTARRTWPAITDFSEIVTPLPRPVFQLLFLFDILRQKTRILRQ